MLKGPGSLKSYLGRALNASYILDESGTAPPNAHVQFKVMLKGPGSLKSYLGLRRERCVKISIGWCRNPYRHQAETTYYTWIYSTQRHSARYILISRRMVYQ